MNRHTAREKAFQILFQMDMNEMETRKAIESILKDNEPNQFLVDLVEGVTNNKGDIDVTITEHLENWSLHRLASVERTILRIAVLELQYMDDIPTNVTINEAVELGNKFGDDKSGKFINGVLSRINN